MTKQQLSKKYNTIVNQKHTESNIWTITKQIANLAKKYFQLTEKEYLQDMDYVQADQYWENKIIDELKEYYETN